MAGPPIVQWIGDNIGLTRCQTYLALYGSAYGAAVSSAFTGQFWLSGGLTLLGRAFELSAQQSGCPINPFEPEPPPYDGCRKFSTGVGQYFVYKPDGSEGLFADYIEILDVISRPDAFGSDWILKIIYVAPSGQTIEAIYNDQQARRTAPFFTTRPKTGAVCEEPAPEPTIPPHDPGQPISDPITHTDPDGCNWTIQATDSYINDQGQVSFYYTVTSDNPDVCGGPFAYWDTGGSEPVWVTNPGDDDEGDPYPTPPPEPLPPAPCPDPCPPIPPPHQLGAKTYQLTGICETVPDGQAQPRYDYNIAADRFENVLSYKLDAIALMLQQHLELKTPTCSSNPKPVLRGDWRSVHFESDAPSPSGTRPLRKYFRYRSESGSTVAQLGDHWKDFTWEAGSVCVIHKGGWWGSPQVWAASIDEGKRVIRHAAAEAGIDPDQIGQWIVTGSSDPRYGMPGTMRPVLYDGLTWATARTSPSGPPMLEADP